MRKFSIFKFGYTSTFNRRYQLTGDDLEEVCCNRGGMRKPKILGNWNNQIYLLNLIKISADVNKRFLHYVQLIFFKLYLHRNCSFLSFLDGKK